ncbi:MAG: HNH endonuclease [Candidatus Eisenbacteria bacterium]|nr:HNH endonuclease [Candidatus Eisenbacteria bacterium]
MDRSEVRLAAFEFLKEQTALHGEVLPHRILSRGFEFENRRVPLLGPQGIFKPAVLPRIPLTIRTAPIVPGKPRPYDDRIDDEGTIRYRYRGTDPDHHDNVGLRLAWKHQFPLIYLYGVIRGEYLPFWPVFIVGDDPKNLCFTIRVDDAGNAFHTDLKGVAEAATEERRRYITVVSQRRMHQQGFRRRVLNAYRESCAICRLRHQELLDAAHILPDRDPRGEPLISNGLALCKIHHAAFDRNVLGIRPDHRVEIRTDILEEEDGPMLRHGLQDIHGEEIFTPRRPEWRPNPDYLAARYEIFRRTA